MTNSKLNIKHSSFKITPVILSGGSGTRLWPLSRKEYPKQYLPLVGDNTMLQEIMKVAVGFKGKLSFDTEKSDGTLRKLIDITRLKNMGWKYSVDLEDGLSKMYRRYLDK